MGIQWKSSWNSRAISISILMIYKWKSILYPVEISIKFKWKPIKIKLQFNGNFNGITEEFIVYPVEISMINQ